MEDSSWLALRFVLPRISSFTESKALQDIETFLYILVESLERQAFLEHLSLEIERSMKERADTHPSIVPLGEEFFADRVIRQYFASETWIHFLSVVNICDNNSTLSWNNIKKVLKQAHSDESVFQKHSISQKRLKVIRSLRNSKIAHHDSDRYYEMESLWVSASSECGFLINQVRQLWQFLYEGNEHCNDLTTPTGSLGRTHKESFDFLCELWIEKGHSRAARLVAMHKSLLASMYS